jgi:hypothetical protein
MDFDIGGVSDSCERLEYRKWAAADTQFAATAAPDVYQIVTRRTSDGGSSARQERLWNETNDRI